MDLQALLKLRTKFLRVYYLSTPVFIILDIAGDLSVRASGLDTKPTLKYLYYAVCFALGLLCRRSGAMAPVFGLIESSINVLLLVLSVMLPIYETASRVAEGAAMIQPFGPQFFANFAISAVVLCICFYSNPLLRPGGSGGSPRFG